MANSSYYRISVEKYGFNFTENDNEQFTNWNQDTKILYKFYFKDYKRKFITHCKCGEVHVINGVDLTEGDYYLINDVYCDKCGKLIFKYNQFIQPFISGFDISDRESVKLIEDKYKVTLSKCK